MAGLTPYFGLAYFTFGDNLGDGINVQKEINRFLLIDKQLYGLYAIFGNGVISGWDLSVNDTFGLNTIALNVSTGVGIINTLAVQTDLNDTISDLPPNETVDIYAAISSGTVRTRDVNFIWSRTIPGRNVVQLARVTTDSSSVTNIDTSFRQEISFLEFIKDEIAKHKHRGTPSKIDLPTETRNQLPGARLEDFDASKIISGRFPVDRIPQLDHDSLKNTGLLTHAALDSFARLITSGNKELLGEVSTVNTMKLITSQYYLANQMGLDFKDIVDFPNLLVCYPGITPDNILDIDSSTSVINTDSNCISGKPIKQGTITSIVWNTTSAFLTNIFSQNVTIAQNSVSLTRGGGSSTSIENFELVARSGVAIPGFSTQVQITTDTIAVNSDSSNKTEGFYSGKFTTERNYRILYTKTLSQNKDWTIYDELLLDVKSLSISHGPVYMYFINGTGDEAVKSQDYLILSQDEITENIDPSFGSFERRLFDISNEQKDNVTQIIFYTDDAATKQVFWVDNIFLRNQSLFPPTGVIRFKYSSGAKVLFSAINYECNIPEGCEIRVRIRTANSSSLLSRASFTPNLNSGDVFSLDGTDAEIEVMLIASSDKTLTPTLTKLELQIIVDSEVTGFTISNADQWAKGTFSNVQQSGNEITTTSSVGNIYYIYQNGVSENDTDGVSVYGFRGILFSKLLSPQQAINISSPDFSAGFTNPYSVYRQNNRNFIIADTANDRIIETHEDGVFIRGIGGHNVSDSSHFYPLTSVYNPRKGTLTVCFSQELDLTKIDISKIKIWIGSASILLGPQDTTVDNGKNLKILEILLANDRIEALQDPKFDVSVEFLTGFFSTAFDYPASSKLLTGPRGLPVFIGDFVYMNEINRPIFANLLSNGNFIIANSSIAADQTSTDSATSITVEVGQSTSFTVTVDIPTTGIDLQWEQNIPVEIQSIVTFSSPVPGNIGTVNINFPTSDQIRTWQLLFTAVYTNTATGAVIARTTNTVVLNIVAASTDTGSSDQTTPPIVEINFENETIEFSYDALVFSDFTLGSVYEIDSNKLMISGIVKNDNALPITPGSSATESYEDQAVRKLSGYSGKTIIINKNDKAITFEYSAADNSYPSDAVLDDSGSVVIAETSFIDNAGRVIKLDPSGNIVWQISGGLLSKVNDVRAKINGDIIVST